MVEIQKSVNLQELHKSWSKRGAFDALGNIASDLMAFLDNRYAADIQNIIRQMQWNEKEAFNIINQHTIIINQTANLLNRITFACSHKWSFKVNKTWSWISDDQYPHFII